MNFIDSREPRWQIEIYSSEHGGRARWLPLGGLYNSKAEADRDAAEEHSKRRGETFVRVSKCWVSVRPRPPEVMGAAV